MVRDIAAALVAQVGTEEVTGLSHAIERGGLYTIIAILIFAVIFLFVLKERQREKFHEEFQLLQKAFQEKLLQLVEAQTHVITKQAILTEKVDGLLTRVIVRLEGKEG